MRETIHLNNDWEFVSACDSGFLNGEGAGETVRLPHTCKLIPYDYFDESIYRMVCGYRKRLDLRDRGIQCLLLVGGGARSFYAMLLLCHLTFILPAGSPGSQKILPMVMQKRPKRT